MSDFTQAPLVPRSSKQAKMLGVAVDDLPNANSPLSPLSRTHSGAPAYSPGLASGSVYPQQGATAAGLEGWNGWAAPHSADSSSTASRAGQSGSAAAATNGVPLNRVESGISPFASTSSIAGPSRTSLDHSRRKTSILPLSANSHLRGSRSASGLRSSTGERDTSQSGTGKKRGLFGSLLKRRNSKGDKGDGNSSDSATIAEFGIPPRPVQYDTLPAKLQARGDALDTGSILARNAMGGRTKDGRPLTPNRTATMPSTSAQSMRPLPQAPRDGGSDFYRPADHESVERLAGSSSEGPNGAALAAAAQLDAPTKRSRTSAGEEMPGMDPRGSVSSGGSASTSRTGSVSQGRSRNGSNRSGGTGGRKASLASSAAGTLAAAATKRPSAPNPYAAASAVAFWNFNGSSEKNATAKAAAAGSTGKGSSPAASLKSGTARSVNVAAQPDRPSSTTRRAATPSGLTGAVRTDGAHHGPGHGFGVTNTYSFPDRKASMAVAGRGTGGAAGSAGAWQAPDSWAVKPEGAASFDADTDDGGSDDDDDDDADDIEEDLLEENGFDSDDESFLGPRESVVPLSGAVGGDVRPFGSLDGDAERGRSRAGRPSTGGGRPNTRNGRPGTADGEGRKASQKPFMIRVFRVDGTFSTLPVPLNASASELTTILARKFQVNTKQAYALYIREKGIERRVGPNEKPVQLQKRRFEQAGYTELDKLEELGREDNSYLSKIVYKAQYSTMSAVTEDDFAGESMEFVDLSGKGVETIPIFLYKHAHVIRSLNLSKNRPFDLPTDFVQGCTSLREVVLSDMGIKRVPQAIKECVHLERLDISNNNIVDLDHIALDELKNLTSIKCHNNRLSTVPEGFRNMRHLRHLNLSNNRFDKLPLVISEIESLIELDLSFNTLTVVPAEIGQLENLERLNLLANLITSLPATLGSLVSLREIDCRRNVISDLSPLTAIRSLEVLRCDHNQVSSLDATWANLRTFTAKHNSFTRFALSGTSTTLTSLNLSHCKLSNLSMDVIGQLGAVETLTLDGNTLRLLPDNIGTLSRLVTLSVKNNLLTSLPDSLGRLQNLQALQVSGNNLHGLPHQIWFCAQLATINASSNLIKEFPDPPMQTATTTPPNALDNPMETIDVRKQSMAPGGSRVALPLSLALQRLYLADNQLGDDVFAPISLMAELRLLNLSFNDIYEIPASSLFKCQRLEELYLSGNKLTTLPPDDLERLVNLRVIYVNGNKLQTLPAELGKIKKLYALDVGSNVLKYNIANWPYDWNWNWNLELRFLNLSGNKRLEIKPGHGNDAPGFPRNAQRRNLADFTALTRMHVLGLMDVTLMIPSVPDENEDRRVRTSLSEINDMGYGIADTLGSRVDTLSLVDIVIPRFRSKDDEAIFGLFDAVNKGQGTGAKLVKYLQDSFSAVFTLELSRLKSGEVTSDALRRAFLNINRDYGNLLIPALDSRRKGSEISLTDRAVSSVRTGAAGVIVYIHRKRLYVANAGNSLAVLAGRGGTARLIARRHEPFDSGEIARIRTAEGWISHRGYVNDEVDIARSFGFYNVFPAVNAAPDVDEIELTEADEFVIIANRGLWEHMSYQAAVDVARTERSDPMSAAAKLRDLAISYGSTSNIMVMVIAVGDLFKAKKGGFYARSRVPLAVDDGFYGAHKAGVVSGRRGKGDDTAGERYLNLLDREVAPPVGMVALVFTDIRNSTALWESNPGMQTAIRMHNQLLRRQLRAIGGYEVKTEGDAFMVSFPTVTSALLWCLTVQLELLREDWPQEILDSEEGKEILDSRGEIIYRGLSVRMGIHWGEPVCEADPITRRMDYFGPIVNRAARISAVADGGQISASQDVIEIIQDVVMQQQKPATDEFADLDAPEENESVEEYLDPRDRQDIAALRRLGFGITELGERKLKGLESAELISLIWPTALKERIAPSSAEAAVDATSATLAGQKTELVQDATPQILDVNLIKRLGKLVQRLESVCGVLVHGFGEEASETLTVLGNGNSSARPSTPAQREALAKRGPLIHPTSLASPVRADATDDELAALLESYLVRVENCLSTLTLHQLGPFTEVLSALGQAVRLDPRSIALALTRFAGLMQAEALSPPSAGPSRRASPSRPSTPGNLPSPVPVVSSSSTPTARTGTQVTYKTPSARSGTRPQGAPQ
ncbi:hypothetical protein JCM10908_002119 [Rhodotorula pacifica]|uniref:adenylate cyclase n=1 Tax=Rhodotorula pacifica TaxID=1495444 RepID=UPI00316CCEA8